MSTREQTKDRVTTVVALTMGVPTGEIQGDTKLFATGEELAGLGVGHSGPPGDSLDRVELVMALEEEFEIEIPDDDMTTKLETVDGIVEYLATSHNVVTA